MRQANVSIKEGASAIVDFANIVISVRALFATRCEASVGHPGLPNVIKEFRNGDAVLFETPLNGTIEVRAVALSNYQVAFLVTVVAPQIGILAGAVEGDPNNTPFTADEQSAIKNSVTEIKENIAASNILTVEQLGLLERRLDEIQQAASRMGRKDWINYVAGSLTGLVISAGFSPDVTRKIFIVANEAFLWLFSSGILLLK